MNIKSIITSIRLRIFGPRKVASVVRTFTKAAQDLQEAAEHHAAAALASLAVAAQHKADALEADATAQHALRVKARIDTIIA